MGPARTGSWKCGVLGLPPGVLWKHHGHGGHEIYLRAVACNGCIARIRHIGRSCYSKFTSSIINLHQTSSNQINLPLNYPKLCHSKKEQIFWLSIDLGVPSFIDPGQGRLHLAQRGGSASGAVSCALETRQHHGWELNERNHAGIL